MTRKSDIFNDGKHASGLDTRRQESLERTVDDFADNMVRFYDDEGERTTTGLRTLNINFSVPLDGQDNVLHLQGTSVDGRMKSDGHFVGKHGAICCVVEFKNEPCNIHVLADIELTGYIAHSLRVAMSSHQSERVFRGWRVLCLGITVVGEWIFVTILMRLMRL